MKLARIGWVVSVLVLGGCSEKPHPSAQAVPAEKAPVASAAAPLASTAAPTGAPAAAPPRTVFAEPRPAATLAEKKPASADAKESDAATLHVKRLVIARNVEKREPVDAATSFKKSELGKLYAFVEVENPEKGKSGVVVKFVRPGGKLVRTTVALDVGEAPRWRTWASTRNVDELGTWQAVVTTKDGRELARQSFDVVADDGTVAL